MPVFDSCIICNASWWADHKADCSIAAEKFLASLKNDKQATADHDPRCPHCGMGDECWTESAPRNCSDGSEWSITCPHCEKEYKVQMTVTYHFRVELDE